jgi:signal transduction histidine kinase
MAAGVLEPESAPLGLRTRPGAWFLPWLAVATLCVAVMAATPGEEVIPFHLIWITFALVYGFDPWPVRRTAIAVAAAGVASGAVLLTRAASDVVSWDETFEIPLMVTLAALVVWHVQRRESALATVRAFARRQARDAAQRERLTRLGAHEMRTPLTIATSYVGVMIEQETDPDRLADLDVVSDELSRLARAGDRVLRMIRVADHLPRSAVDVDSLLHQTRQRWSTVGHRQWVVEAGAGTMLASLERLRVCLDTLVENALRYTGEEDTVRLAAFRRDGEVWMAVADSGPGLTEAQLAAINDPRQELVPEPGSATPDPRSQTGLGIGLVREIVEARQGRLLAGRSREGGALLALRLPVVL